MEHLWKRSSEKKYPSIIFKMGKYVLNKCLQRAKKWTKTISPPDWFRHAAEVIESRSPAAAWTRVLGRWRLYYDLIHTYIQTNTYKQIHTNKYIHTCMHAYIHTYLNYNTYNTYKTYKRYNTYKTYIHTNKYIHTCMHACIHTYILKLQYITLHTIHTTHTRHTRHTTHITHTYITLH